MSLANIRDRVLQICGVASSTDAFWGNDLLLYRYINTVGQSIPIKVGMLLKTNQPVLIDFWRTKVNSATTGSSLVIAASSSTAYLPIDYYHYASFYDLTAKRPIPVIISTGRGQRNIDNLRKKPAGPPEAIEILDMTTNGTYWQRKAQLVPDTPSGVTPSVELVYYRVPASMPGSNPNAEYPDAPVEFHPLWIYGTIVELMARSDPNFDRYKNLHDELISALSIQARVVR